MRKGSMLPFSMKENERNGAATMTDKDKVWIPTVSHCQMPGCSYETKDGRKYCESCLFLRMIEYRKWGKLA